MSIQIITKPMTILEVRKLADEWYGTLIKGCVDVSKDKVALGGDYHMESCELLVADGSSHQNVWGFNVRFDSSEKGEIEFDSLVNIKPSLGNKSRRVEDPEIISRATATIRKWIIFE
jgi:hypothetical protein